MATQSQTLLHLIANGIYFDEERRHLRHWTRAISRLLRIRPALSFTDNPVPLEKVKHYPALLVLMLAVLTATAVEREDVAVAVLRDPRWQQIRDSPGPLPAANALHYWNVLDDENVKGLGRFRGQQQRSRFLSSELTFADIRPALDVLSLNPVELVSFWDDAEYRLALAQRQFRPRNQDIYALEPVVGPAYSHNLRNLDVLPAQDRFVADGDHRTWGLTPDTIDVVVGELRQSLKDATRGMPL